MIVAPTVQTVWTERDLDIVETLVCKVRMLTVKQTAHLWWSCCRAKNEYALRRLKKLRKAGLLACYDVNLHPPLELTQPLWIWQPGWPVPDFEQLAYEGQTRWTKPSRSKPIYIATPKAIYLYGGYGRGQLGTMFQWTHDYHMTEVYCYFKQHREEDFQNWIGEDGVGKGGYREKNPDAFIVVDEQRIRAIDFVGRYDANRLQDLHVHCQERELPYELW